MLEVKVYSIKYCDDRDIVGTIRYDGQKLIPSPSDSRLLQSVISERIIGLYGKPYFPKEDPEGFIRNLCFQYSGSRFRVSEAYET